MGKLQEYLEDPLLNYMYTEVRKAGPLRAILVDITQSCNIRCEGCFFFAEEMDSHKAPDEEGFEAFVQSEIQRGTNFMTIAGGEPSLMLNRVKRLYDTFWVACVTNGIKKIPYEGFEKMPIAVSVWGDHDTDKLLRGKGKLDVFAKGLAHYKDDPRVFWYYTTTPGNWDQIERVTEECIQNGNWVLYNFYGDLAHLGGAYDHRQGFAQVRGEIDKMIDRYPDRILITSYVSQTITSARLYDEEWGYDVCGSLTFDHPINAERIKNGKPYNPHFRSVLPDLQSTRRCCVGEARDCATCFDVWGHFSWIMLNMKRHMRSQDEFMNWLTTTYMFYLINRIVDWEEGLRILPQIHERQRALREVVWATAS